MAKQDSRYISWRDEFSIGIPHIDDQHKRLFGLLNQLNSFDHSQSSNVPQSSSLLELFDNLSDYAAQHFRHEETLMRKHVPTEESTTNHIVAHRTYWTIIVTLKNRFLKGDAKVNDELVGFLNRWWIDHILKTDQELGRQLNRRGVC